MVISQTGIVYVVFLVSLFWIGFSVEFRNLAFCVKVIISNITGVNLILMQCLFCISYNALL